MRRQIECDRVDSKFEDQCSYLEVKSITSGGFKKR